MLEVVWNSLSVLRSHILARLCLNIFFGNVYLLHCAHLSADTPCIVTVRLHPMQVCAVRNLFVEKGFSPAHFLDHAAFDCGTLD